MSISDDLMWRYYELLTDLTTDEVAALKAATEKGDRHPRDVKAELGRRIVADFHSPSAAQEASDEFDHMFREKQAPTDIPVLARPATPVRLAKFLAAEGLAPSVAEAQRLIGQGGVRVNNEVVGDSRVEIGATAGEEILIQVGKRKFVKVIFT